MFKKLYFEKAPDLVKIDEQGKKYIDIKCKYAVKTCYGIGRLYEDNSVLLIDGIYDKCRPAADDHFKFVYRQRYSLSLDEGIIQRKLLCKSPSMAACIITGNQSNGWYEWKDSKGREINCYTYAETDVEQKSSLAIPQIEETETQEIIEEEYMENIETSQEQTPITYISDKFKLDYARHISNEDDYKVCTPIKIAEQMVDLIPAEMFNENTTFLDIYCKTGVFLIAIRNRLMQSRRLIDAFPNPKDRRRHIESKQLFGLCWKKQFYEPSLCNVYDTVLRKGNIYLINKADSYIKNTEGINKIIKETFENMKFDVIVGNPPYQDEKNSIYQKFIELGCDIAKCNCLITRNNWFNGKAFSNTRKKC